MSEHPILSQLRELCRDLDEGLPPRRITWKALGAVVTPAILGLSMACGGATTDPVEPTNDPVEAPAVEAVEEPAEEPAAEPGAGEETEGEEEELESITTLYSCPFV